MPSNKLPISLRYYFRTDMLMMLIGAFIGLQKGYYVVETL
jgi:hypothetical protein